MTLRHPKNVGKKRIYRGTYSTQVEILGCFCPKYGQKIKFIDIFKEIHLLGAEIDNHIKFW